MTKKMMTSQTAPTIKDSVNKQKRMREKLEQLFFETLNYLQAGLKGEVEGLKVNAAFISTVIDFLKLNNVNMNTLTEVGMTQEERIKKYLDSFDEAFEVIDKGPQ